MAAARSRRGGRGADRPPGALGAGRPDGLLEPVGPQPQQLGERVLQRRRALDELELARLPVRLLRPLRRDDRGQAPAGPVGAVAVGAGLRLPPPEHARTAGPDGGRERGARVRPRASALRASRGLHRGPGPGAHADHGCDLAAQQPRRPAGAHLRGGGVVRGPRTGRRPHALAAPVRRLRGARLRDQDGSRAGRGPRDRRRLDMGRTRCPGKAPRAAPAAGGRGRDAAGGRSVAGAGRTDPGELSSLDLRAPATTVSSR